MSEKRYVTTDDLLAKYQSSTSEWLKVQLTEAKQIAEELEKVLRERGRINQPHARYKFHATKADPYWNNGLEDGIVLIGECTNSEEMSAHLKLYGSSAAWDERITSVTYFRMNGLILHCSGGHIVLKTPGGDKFNSHNMPIPCTDEQWKLLQSGTVPTEMLSDYYQK